MPGAQGWPAADGMGALEADSGDAEALADIAGRARAILTFAGPYRKYGFPVAKACAEAYAFAANFSQNATQALSGTGFVASWGALTGYSAQVGGGNGSSGGEDGDGSGEGGDGCGGCAVRCGVSEEAALTNGAAHGRRRGATCGED